MAGSFLSWVFPTGPRVCVGSRIILKVALIVATWAVGSVCHVASWGRDLNSGCCERSEDVASLVEKLSPTAHIYFPGSNDFSRATKRWSALKTPGVRFVVVPTTENDVAETVKYANQRGVPFLAVNAGHGAIITQGNMQNGIQIWLNQLNSVEIAADGQTATIGGGTLSHVITSTLWAAGKQTVTGGCECVSLLGPGLGGGHGFLQGRHGLISDQFVSMNIVLADGTIQRIDEESDLWWAMQGAGHNFGIVTSVTSKIYDVEHPDWAYASFILSGDKVEDLYENINTYIGQNGNHPVDVINYSFFFNSPDLDPERPVIMFFILQEGVQTVDPIYTTPFDQLAPIVQDSGSGSYPDLPRWTANSLSDAPCQKAGYVNNRFPIDLPHEYDIPSQREVYDLFASATHDTPELAGSLFLFEGYSTQGVRAVASDSTAFPFREDRLLVAPLIIYNPAGPELDNKAADLGNSLRQILYQGSGREELHTYVNYAYGNENFENWYGYEPWRQEKLRNLKNKYDPDGKFNFYAKIV